MESKGEQRLHPYWYQDCLGVTTILAGCLTSKELIKQGRRIDLWRKGPPAEIAQVYRDVHEACHSRPDLRKNITKQIRSRSAGLIRKVGSAEVNEIKAMAEFTARPTHLLFACLSDPREEVRSYGHNLNHSLLWEAIKETFVLNGDLPEKERNEVLQKRLQNLAKENLSLKRRLDAADKKLKLMKKKKTSPPPKSTPPTGNLGQQREIRKLCYEVARLKEELAGLREVEDRTASPPTSPRIILHRAEVSPQPDCDRCREEVSCVDCPLEGRRVAVIGGLDRMEAIYRKVVEGLGAEFEFHCGRVKDGCQTVQGLINRSDIVIFITTVNSHAALKVTKTICKKKYKKFIALRERGAGSLERTLRAASVA